ncbi:preprotein translocase subunit SecE [Synechocystis sp. LKSZ1]|uniref:preprotein translocase subunit SecE n=1 Tax=Synechocystis sp. LKSZ1 TaxID=3144951 RepID=UPI00336BFFB7
MAKQEATKPDSLEANLARADNARRNFVTETKEELAKVVWPSRQQLISESVAVILMVTLVATTIYLVDNFFGWVTRQPFLFG